jgi:type I restriction enzyme M protein
VAVVKAPTKSNGAGWPAARLTQSELESYLWGAATLLRGLIDAGDYKQFIFPLLFFKRVSDVYDEELVVALAEGSGDEDYARFAEHHRFQIPDGAHWRDVRAVTRDVGRALQDAMRAIEAANPGPLEGIFGDAPWTNKERLPDETLRNLIEHFSSRTLSVACVPEDELGNAYEFLIKKFADDSGHTAAEFYTNRTVVHLMTRLVAPQPGESIYDPTCGTGGMLISALDEVKRQGGEHRTLRLYGQERNLMTSAIARMNLFLHGVEDFQIVRGDTLAAPKLLDGDRLRRFDVVLANPPYSIKQWNRELFQVDPWGRNLFGAPPQSSADFAFVQHILASMDCPRGRSVSLLPHGFLARESENAIRERLVESGMLEAIIGLGRRLFYNSGMESCLLVCRSAREQSKADTVLFIDAADQVAKEGSNARLLAEHQERILTAYRRYTDIDGFSRVVPIHEIRAAGYALGISRYVRRGTSSPAGKAGFAGAWSRFNSDSASYWRLISELEGIFARSVSPTKSDE